MRNVFIIASGFLLTLGTTAFAQEASRSSTSRVTPEGGESTSVNLQTIDPEGIINNATRPEKLSSTLEIMLILTVLSLAPAILVMTTSFTRIVVVLALLRQALGTQQLPPSQVIIGLALFMTFCVMNPTWNKIQADAIGPYVDPPEGVAPIDRSELWDRSTAHVRHFMITQIENTGNTEDVYMFVEFDDPDAEMQTKIQKQSLEWRDVSLAALIPAFVTSELKQAFIMGFYIYLPFLIIDMVVASILMSMGMMMLPPILISLPFKLLLFVMVDGWHLVVGSLIAGFTNNPVM